MWARARIGEARIAIVCVHKLLFFKIPRQLPDSSVSTRGITWLRLLLSVIWRVLVVGHPTLFKRCPHIFELPHILRGYAQLGYYKENFFMEGK
jgi:hypothetical protein